MTAQQKCPTCGKDGQTMDGAFDANCPAAWAHKHLLPDRGCISTFYPAIHRLRDVCLNYLGTENPDEVADWIAEARALARSVSRGPAK